MKKHKGDIPQNLSIVRCHYLTIIDCKVNVSNNEYIVPFLRIRGKWLEKNGFGTGQKIKVIATPNLLIITPSDIELNENKNESNDN